jgi:MYXO-CTERM domain-containing protein
MQRTQWSLGFALVFAFLAAPRPAAAQFTATAGNVTLKLTIPAGVTQVKGVLTFTVRGLASGWAANASFQELAKRLNAGIAMVSGGDDLNDGSYPNRCKSGEFNNIPMAFEKLAADSKHPELAHVPLVGLGHSHGGDYWNWFNACHPDRMAMVFVHASGGVNYNAGALKTPVFYTLGTADLVERGSGKPRAGMFVNRGKGAPMTLVIGVGGHDSQFSAEEYQIVTALIEAIFKMRVPADADAAKGPVPLNDIVEGESTWVGDLYTKEISTYSAFKGNKALTAFLPSEQLAMMWKPNGPALPKTIVLPTGSCGWCGNPKDEPPATPGKPAPPPPDTDSPSPDGGAAPAADAGETTTPPPKQDASAKPSTTPEPDPDSDSETDAGATSPPHRTGGGGCSVVSGEVTQPGLALVLFGVLWIWRRRR